MDSDEESDNDLFMCQSLTKPDDIPVPGRSQLKPKLDSIFAEVEKNLPSIDFDLSDVSDSEEQGIFQRSLTLAAFDDDKDLDTSMSGESLSDLLPPIVDNMTIFNSPDDASCQTIIDNDMAAKKYEQKSKLVSKGTVTSWTEAVIEARDDKTKFEERDFATKIQSWVESEKNSEKDFNMSINAVTAMANEIGIGTDDLSSSYDSESFEKHENESTSEKTGKSTSYSQPAHYSSGDKRMDRMVMKEERRRHEEDLVTSIVSPNAPSLLSSIGNLNIDLILNSLNEDIKNVAPTQQPTPPPQVRQAWVQQEVQEHQTEVHFASGEGSNRLTEEKNNENNRQQTLIQRLAEFSAQQSGEDLSSIDPLTGATLKPKTDEDADINTVEGIRSSSPLFIRRKHPSLEKSKEATEMPKFGAIPPTNTELESAPKITSSCGTNTNDFQPLRIITPTPRPKTDEDSKKEPETVFIDLRNFDQKCKEQQQSIDRVKQVLRLQPDSSSDSSDSEHEQECWFEQRRRIKQALASKGTSTEASTSKPRSKWSEPVKPPQRVIDLSEYDNRLASRAQGAGEPDDEIDPVQAAQIAARKKAIEEEKEKQRKAELARKQREEREAERQARLRLSKRLDALRPTASVSGKQDCAETTPVLFDMEASYEPAPKSLPSILPPEQEVLLLTIHLSSNGEIILHRGKTNKSVDTGVGLSASYTVLLSWLLSLVPENYSFLQSKLDSKKPENVTIYEPPFYVLGLQQLWMDEHLYLFVTITPAEQFDAKSIQGKVKKSKLKDEVKDSSPFQHMVSKFLSTNTLHSVCPWLQDMVSVEVPCPTGNSEEPPKYIYRPPLPNITTKPLSTFVQINPDLSAAQKVFNTSLGFFWQTVDNDESSFEQILNDSEVLYDTQITMSLVYKKIFHDPRDMMGIFNRILQEGLDLAGVRLVYPSAELLNNASGKPNVPNETEGAHSDTDLLNKIGPILAIGLRGTFSRSIWLDAIGPSDPVLARRTDPNSLCALYGGSSREECLLFCPRNPSRVQTELTRWFGGRVPPGGVIDVGTPYTRKDNIQSGTSKGRKTKKLSSSDDKEEMSKNEHQRPPAGLSATTKSDIFLILSAHVPPKCIGIIMATCQRRGYQIRGIRRSRLTTKKASCLGIDSDLFSTFCPGTPSVSIGEHAVSTSHQSKNTEAVSPCTILLLEKENAAHSAASLIEACMMQLTLQGIMGSIQKLADHDLFSKHLFHAARYSDTLLTNLGGDFTKCIDHEIQVNHSFVVPQLYTNPEVEQIAVVMLLGHDILKSCGLFIGKLLNMVPYSRTPAVLPLKEGFELLGIKWVASLTTTQAKEVTPYEVGDRQWKENIHLLTTEPAVVLVLRGVDAFNKLQGVIPSIQPGQSKAGHIDYLMSMNAEEAFSFARAFFTEKELFPDPQSRILLPYLPQSRYHSHGHGSRSQIHKTNDNHEAIFEIMQSGPQPITTLIVIKPRALTKHFPKILRKIMQEGFKIVGMKLFILKPEEAMKLINEKGELSNERVEQHIQYLSSGPCVSLVLQRENAVKKLLDLLGPADPMNARRQSQFLWRGTFGMDPVKNALHGSTTYINAIHEQKLFFPDGLCCTETEDLKEEKIPCPAVDDIIDVCYHNNRDIIIHDIGDCTQEILESHLLLQTTCIVLKPSLLHIHDRGDYAYVEIIESLVKYGFEIVGARMIWFTKEQAEVFLHVVNAGSFKQLPELLSGPSIVLALQRDNAVIAFDSILGSDYVSGSLIGKFGEHMSRPADISQAQKMLMFFFNKLIPGCQAEIIQK